MTQVLLALLLFTSSLGFYRISLQINHSQQLQAKSDCDKKGESPLPGCDRRNEY